MTTTANPGAETPFAPAAGVEVAERGAGLDHQDSPDLARTVPSDHDPEAKALLRRYLSDVHSYRENGNHALRSLEARLATMPPQPGPSRARANPARGPQGAERTGYSSHLIMPSLPGGQGRNNRADAGLTQRLRELSAYLHADLTEENAEPDPVQEAYPPHARQRVQPTKIPTLPVLDRAWFEERFAVMRTSMDRLSEQLPLNRIERLEAQFGDLMERLTVRETARDPRPLEASLKHLAAYLADSRQWAAANEKRVRGMEGKLEQLSSLVAQSHAAISETAKGLELVAKGTGETLARKTADIVIARIGDKLEGWNPNGRIDQLGREVAHLTAQSRHLARSAEDRLEQIQNTLREKSKPVPRPPAGPAVRPPAIRAVKPDDADNASRDELESYLNQPIDLDEDYDSDMIAAAQHAARIADGPALKAPSHSGPVRYQIPYGEFLPDEDGTPSRAGLIVAVVILLLAGATMLFLKAKEWTLVEPQPAAFLEGTSAPVSASASKQARLMVPGAEADDNGEGAVSGSWRVDVPVVTGSTPAAPPLSLKPMQLWVASKASDGGASDAGRPEASKIAAPKIAAPDTAAPETSFREAAVKGDLDAQFSVGQSYLSGEDGEGNLSGGDRLSKAARWFRRAAEGGHAPSQYRIATLYELGHGTPRDVTEAESWYGRAASQGHVKAMHNLAVLAASKNGKGANYVTAARWFKEAAAYGLVDSQFNLGILHERGLGLPQNLIEAYRWFALAARGNDDKARHKRDEIGGLLSLGDRQKAERLVSDFTIKARSHEINRLAPEPPAGGDEDRPSAPRTADAASAAVMRASWKTDVAVLPNATGSAAMIAETQRLLKRLGFDPGPADGFLGPRTQNAIREYQRRAGLTTTGETSENMIVKMAFLPL